MDVAIIALFGLGGLGFVGYQFYSFFFGISGTRSEVEKDIKLLTHHVESVELAPWPIDEIDILSRFGESNLDRKLFGEVEHGVIYSIYHEPLIAFATKHYSTHSGYLLVFKINDDVYDIKVQNDKGILHKNHSTIGEIKANNDISVHHQTKALTLTIDADTARQLMPVYINDKQIASINKEDLNDGSRVIVPTQDLSVDEMNLFIIGLTFSIIDQRI